MALCLKHSVLSSFHPRNILLQTMIVNSDVLLVPNILDPLGIPRNWRSHHTSLRILRRVANEYGHSDSMVFMLPSSGTTLQQNFLKISELPLDLICGLWVNDRTLLHANCVLILLWGWLPCS
jgi:hypothetical protein